MFASLRSRLRALEERAPKPTINWSRVICHSEQEAAAVRAACRPDEGVIIRLIVSPGGPNASS